LLNNRTPIGGTARAAGSALDTFPTHLTRSLPRRRAVQVRGWVQISPTKDPHSIELTEAGRRLAK